MESKIDMRELAESMHSVWATMQAFDCNWDAMPEKVQDSLCVRLDATETMIEGARWLGFKKVGE